MCGLPFCPAVSSLLAACQPSGSCLASGDAAGSRQCYANGVKVTSTVNRATLGVTVRVTKPDGVTPCYSVDLGARLPSGAQLMLVRDGAGNVVSSGQIRPNGRLSFTCAAGTNDDVDQECMPLARSGICRAGTCN